MIIYNAKFNIRTITDEETWVYECGIETVQQSGEWRSENEPTPKKPKFTEGIEGLNTLKAGHLSRGLEYGKLKGVCFESDNKDLY